MILASNHKVGVRKIYLKYDISVKSNHKLHFIKSIL